MNLEAKRRISNLTVLIGLAAAAFIFLGSCLQIGLTVRQQCQQAQQSYAGDCVESLTALLEDETQSYKLRNRAVWSLGQLGDSRALPVLENYYTGQIAPRESLDEAISQHELKKAINLTSGGFNMTAWVWRNELLGF